MVLRWLEETIHIMWCPTPMVVGTTKELDPNAHQGTTKREAIDAAREVSRNQGTELFIHGRDGRIQSRDSHGGDPFPPRG